MKKKKDEKKEKEIEEEATEVEKTICANCDTLNDSDANYCKKCGLPITASLKRSKVFLFISTIFNILSLTMVVDVIWITKPLIGTLKWDNIIIEYAYLLAGTLFLSTCFRLLGEGKKIQDLIKLETLEEPKTTKELRLILAILICAFLLFIYTNTRIMFLKPGNNYVERRVGQHITRWYKVRYERTGVRKCPDKKKIWKNFYIKTPFCYEYTYKVKFRDGDSCYIHYTSEYNHKINVETFSYCSKK